MGNQWRDGTKTSPAGNASSVSHLIITQSATTCARFHLTITQSATTCGRFHFIITQSATTRGRFHHHHPVRYNLCRLLKASRPGSLASLI